MNIAFSSEFNKKYKKLSRKFQSKFDEKVCIFEKDEFDSTLNNHRLHGEYVDHRSINITGNIRAIYKIVSKDNYYFINIGTHSELYE